MSPTTVAGICPRKSAAAAGGITLEGVMKVAGAVVSSVSVAAAVGNIAMGDGLLLLLNHMSHEIRCYSCGFILTRATSSSGTSIDEATAVDLQL